MFYIEYAIGVSTIQKLYNVCLASSRFVIRLIWRDINLYNFAEILNGSAWHPKPSMHLWLDCRPLLRASMQQTLEVKRFAIFPAF